MADDIAAHRVRTSDGAFGHARSVDHRHDGNYYVVRLLTGGLHVYRADKLTWNPSDWPA